MERNIKRNNKRNHAVNNKKFEKRNEVYNMNNTKRIVSMVLAVIAMLSIAATQVFAGSAAADSTSPALSAASPAYTDADTAQHNMVKVTGTKVNLRQGAGTGYAKISTAAKGEQFPLLGEKTVNGSKWYQIQYSASTTAWISAVYSEVTAADDSPTSGQEVRMVTVTGTKVNLRQGAGTGYAKISTAAKGEQFPLLGEKTVNGSKWYQIQYSASTTAWISAVYSEVSAANAPVRTFNEKYVEITADSVELKFGPYSSSADVHSANKGDRFAYIDWTEKFDNGSEWYCVRYAPYLSGWVEASDCRLITTPVENPTVNVVGSLAELRARYSGQTVYNGSSDDYINKLCEYIYGSPADTWTKTASDKKLGDIREALCVGDVLLLDGGSSVMITVIDRDGSLYATGCTSDGSISWDMPLNNDLTVRYIYHHSSNNFRSNVSTDYLDGDFSDALGRVRIISNGSKASAYPFGKKDAAIPASGDVYYYYDVVHADMESFIRIRLESGYVWMNFYAVEPEFNGSFSYIDDETELHDPYAIVHDWVSEEAMNEILLELKEYSKDRGLTYTNELSLNDEGDKLTEATNGKVTQKDLLERLKYTFDHGIKRSSYELYDFSYEKEPDGHYVFTIYLG